MTKKPNTDKIVVEVDVPEGCTKTDIKEYVLDAVCTMKGSYRPPGGESPSDPGDPMFDLDADSVRVWFYRR